MRRLWQRFWDCSVRSKRREATWNLAASQAGAGATGYLIDDLRPAPGGSTPQTSSATRCAPAS